jgi:hypothetical protein
VSLTGQLRSVYAASNNTLEFGTERGVRVNRIVTPRVAAVARDLFGCPSLRGAELENQPTISDRQGPVCYGSHWDARLFLDEVSGTPVPVP